jgi:large exoprotein involved in heme utilization and adhesion
LGEGNSGNINIKSGQILLDNIAQIATANTGIGNAGNISLEAKDIVSAANGSIIVSNIGQLNGTPAQGKVGDITIAAKNVSFSSGAQLQAGFYPNSQGESASVSIKANDSISFEGRNSLNGNSSGIFTNVESGALANGSNIKLEANSISFTNGSGLTASNSGTGNSGNILIKADDNFLAANDVLIVSNIGRIDKTPAEGGVGSITLEAKNVALTGLSQIQAGFYSNTQGESGSVSIKAIDSISFDDRSGIFTSVDPNAIANGGDIKLEANSISFTNTSGLSASNSGQGNGGNIKVSTDSLTLDKGSRILASNTPSETLTTDLAGGNIDLSISDKLVLRNNSQITAQANQNANGGNVTINARNRFIVAFPNQNNDITANASQGRGGNINLTAQSIFGLEERPLNPFTNDINASSEFDLQGNISIDTPDIDPSRGLIELPQTVTDPNEQIAQNPCQRGADSEFIITGKGGIPPNPNENLDSDSVRVGLVDPVPSESREAEASAVSVSRTVQRGGEAEEKVSSSNPQEKVPAQGWVFTEDGKVMLTAIDPTGVGVERSRQNPAACAAP